MIIDLPTSATFVIYVLKNNVFPTCEKFAGS